MLLRRCWPSSDRRSRAEIRCRVWPWRRSRGGVSSEQREGWAKQRCGESSPRATKLELSHVPRECVCDGVCAVADRGIGVADGESVKGARTMGTGQHAEAIDEAAERVDSARGSGSDGGGVQPRNGAGGGARDAGAAVARVTPMRSVMLPSVASTEAASLSGMIERAVASGSDIATVERMYTLYERAAARAAKSAFTAALMRAKSEFPRIIKTGSITGNGKDEGGNKIKTKQSTYAKWEEVCQQIEPVLASHDLVLTFETDQSTLDRVSVAAVLTHIDGHSQQSQVSLPIDTGGAKSNVQGWGSSISYGKRYAAFAVLNLVGHDDKDTDGVVPPEFVTEAQIAELTRLIGETKTDINKFLEVGGVESLSDITSAGFSKAREMLLAKKAKQVAS